MLYPTIEQLTKNEFNRYELALATAKCARVLTNEYVKQREAAEKLAAGDKDAARSTINQLNKEYREEKAVKIAITKINAGDFKMVRTEPVEDASEEAAEEAAEATEASETSEN